MLEKSLTKCPLCDCPVINPMISNESPVTPPYPRNEELIDNLPERRLSVIIAAIIFIFIASVCIIIDLFLTPGMGWSKFVWMSLILIWLLFIVPFFPRRRSVYFFAIVDFLSLSAYLFVIEFFTFPGSWFFPLALPILACMFVFSLILIALLKTGLLKGFAIIGEALISVGIVTIPIEFIISNFFDFNTHLQWSWFVFVPCTILAALFFIIENMEDIKQSLIKKFHF